MPRSLRAGSVQPRRLSRDAAVRCARGAMPRPRAPSSCRSGHSLIHPEAADAGRSAWSAAGQQTALTHSRAGQYAPSGNPSPGQYALNRATSLHLLCGPLRSTAWGVLRSLRAAAVRVLVPEDVDRTARGGQQVGAVRVWRALQALDRPSLHLYKQRPKHRMYVRCLHARASVRMCSPTGQGWVTILWSVSRRRDDADARCTAERWPSSLPARMQSPVCDALPNVTSSEWAGDGSHHMPSMPKRPGSSYVVQKRVDGSCLAGRKARP